MERNQFWIERRLTPEVFDHAVARARDERAKAIAAFGQQLIAAASRIAARLKRRGRRLATSPLDQVDPLTR
jgi:hypothetical protein